MSHCRAGAGPLQSLWIEGDWGLGVGGLTLFGGRHMVFLPLSQPFSGVDIDRQGGCSIRTHL